MPVRKVLSLLFVFILTLSLPSFVVADDYTLPGSISGGMTYNNIGLLGEIMVNLNVTLVNTAPYPKFIVVNPRYDFKVLRGNGTEYLYNNRTPNGDIVGHVSWEALYRSVNYLIGFWIAPYETVVVNFRINSNASYVVPLLDYKDSCGGLGRITQLTYNDGNLTSMVINNKGNLQDLVCGSVYPQLINRPIFLSLRTMFPLLDKDIEVLGYRGKVTFRITNVPNHYNRDKVFHVFFAVAQPVIFLGAKTYDYYPNYTMTYHQYISEFIWKYRGLQPPKRENVSVSLPQNDLFKLTNSLLSGVKVGATPKVERKPYKGPDFPVWIIFMGDQVNLTYSVSWNNNSGR
ncbi:hypothetical protein [Thermococcus prieurii]